MSKLDIDKLSKFLERFRASCEELANRPVGTKLGGPPIGAYAEDYPDLDPSYDPTEEPDYPL